MTAVVVLHIALGSETLTAVWTYKGPLVGVDHHVNLQILPLRKRFATVLGRTLKWLSSKMQVHVGQQPNFFLESFVTLLALEFYCGGLGGLIFTRKLVCKAL